MPLRNTLSGVAVGAVAGLATQAYYAGHRVLPTFSDLDPSTAVGSDEGVPLSIVALGDSTLTGPGLIDESDIWLRQAVDRIDANVPITLTSLGVGGAKAADVRRDQLAGAVAAGADIAVVSVGSNDALRGVPLATFRAELSIIVEALVAAGSLVALMGVGDLSTIPRLPAPIAQLADARAARFDRAQARLAEGDPAVVKIPMRELAAEPFRRRPHMFSPDLFHPSAEGHATWADAATPTLARLVRHVAERKQACDA